ncbi:MAG: hypothetical protein ABJG88_03940 [Litorimonas sp.]
MRFIKIITIIVGLIACIQCAPKNTSGTIDETLDYSQASTEELLKRHESGDVHATFSLGFYHFFNEDTSVKEDVKDVDVGLKYLQDAHDKGHMTAHSNLSLIYEMGLFDVEVDEERANNYTLQGAQRGSDIGKLNYGLHNLDNADAKIAQQSHDYLFEIADKDQVGGVANQYLANLYYFGNQHFDVDYESARLFAENCVLFKTSEGRCEFILARDYSQGWGGPENQERSAVLFLQGAERGSAAAMWYAGMNALNGDYVEKNEVDAFKWVKKSAALDYQNALISLGVMHALGQGTDIDYKQAYSSYNRAAILESPHAIRSIAGMYCNGEGRDVDTDKCAAGLFLAWEHGDDQASLLLNDYFSFTQNDLVSLKTQQLPKKTYWTEKYPWLLKLSNKNP